MNHKAVITTLLFGLSSLAAAADSQPVKVCELLQAGNLAPWGYGSHPKTISISQTTGKALLGASSDVRSDICSVNSEIAEQQGTAFFMVESFSDNLGAEAMASWVKISAARAPQPDVKSQELLIGEATCETGEYPIPASESGSQDKIEHFVACDRLVGARHLTINMQQSEAAKLPTPQQVKELLDQVAARLTPQPS